MKCLIKKLNDLFYRIQYIQRRVFDQYRQRSSTTPRTVDLRSMAIRRRRKFTAVDNSSSAGSSEKNPVFLGSLGSREQKIRQHRIRHGSSLLRTTTVSPEVIIDIGRDNDSDPVINDVDHLANSVANMTVESSDSSENSDSREEVDTEEELALEAFEEQEVRDQNIIEEDNTPIITVSESSEYFDEEFDGNVSEASKGFEMIDDAGLDVIDEESEDNVTDENLIDETTVEPFIS